MIILMKQVEPADEILILKFLSYSGCHMFAVHWMYWTSRIWLSIKSHHFYVKMTSSCDNASQHVQERLGTYFKFKNAEFNGVQEKESIICVRMG